MMTKQELADYLKVGVITIERNVKKGMPNYKLPQGSIRFKIEEVEEWMKENANR